MNKCSMFLYSSFKMSTADAVHARFKKQRSIFSKGVRLQKFSKENWEYEHQVNDRGSQYNAIYLWRIWSLLNERSLPSWHFFAWKHVFWNTRRSDLNKSTWKWNWVEKHLKLQIVYISPPSHKRPQKIANVKLYPLRQTPKLVNATNFQLDPSQQCWLHEGEDSNLGLSHWLSKRLILDYIKRKTRLCEDCDFVRAIGW